MNTKKMVALMLVATFSFNLSAHNQAQVATRAADSAEQTKVKKSGVDAGVIVAACSAVLSAAIGGALYAKLVKVQKDLDVKNVKVDELEKWKKEFLGNDFLEVVRDIKKLELSLDEEINIIDHLNELVENNGLEITDLGRILAEYKDSIDELDECCWKLDDKVFGSVQDIQEEADGCHSDTDESGDESDEERQYHSASDSPECPDAPRVTPVILDPEMAPPAPTNPGTGLSSDDEGIFTDVFTTPRQPRVSPVCPGAPVVDRAFVAPHDPEHCGFTSEDEFSSSDED